MNTIMTDEHDFQKRLAKLQIIASVVTTISAILIAVGITIIVTQIPRELYPWNGFTLLGVGVALMLYHLFGIRKNIDNLK